MMRALGPGSVSSFLKIILEVVFAALWVGLVLMSVILFAAVLFSFNPALLANLNSVVGHEMEGRAPTMAAGLLALVLYIAGVLVIVDRLRRIFATLTAGDPFHPDNVRRLRVIGLMLAGLEVGRFLVGWIGRWLPQAERSEVSLNPTAWFSVLVVFVLAEVFREGARLRREAELTI